MSSRKHVVLFGAANAGKSSLFNAILGQPRAIVSDMPGTTADPVYKAMELLPFGPVTLVDTAGLWDDTPLGPEREKKTRRMLDIADLAIYVIDGTCYADMCAPGSRYHAMVDAFAARGLPFLTALTKTDLLPGGPGVMPPCGKSDQPQGHADCFPCAVTPTAVIGVEALKQAAADKLLAHTQAEKSLIGGLLEPGSVVVLVAPIDSEAPVGRLILPQVQLIRDCLDHGVRCHIANEKNLPDALRELARVDLVVTDSQVFGAVERVTPPELPLTSFSILMARQKGDLQALYHGAQALGRLRGGERVLIAEACTHSHGHEDIGRVKLPRLLHVCVRNNTGQADSPALQIDFCNGPSFPDALSDYDLIVHCGGCMLTARMFAARQRQASRQNVPMTNYGMALAYGNGILARSMAIFEGGLYG